MDSSTRFKLAKLAGLLGSDHDGEIVAAAKAIRRLLESQGLSFGDFVRLVSGGSVSGLPAVTYNQEIVGICDAILESSFRMEPHQEGFVRDIRARASTSTKFKMTRKQSDWFNFLYARYGS